jgi:hypothetical protein
MKNQKRPTLIRAMLIKERIFWTRTWGMKRKIGWIGFILVAILVSIGHYIFAGWTFMSEVIMWLFRSPQFKINIQKMCLNS